MTTQFQNNPCFRCGKQRITLISHKEKVGNSTIVVTKTICPDPLCQAIVEKELAKEKNMRDEVTKLKLQRKELFAKRKKEEN